MIVVAAWCVFHLGLFWLLSLLCRRLLGFEASTMLFETPRRALLPSLGHVLIVVASVFGLLALPGLAHPVRSAWFAMGAPSALLVCGFLALLPTALNALFVLLRRPDPGVGQRPPLSYPAGGAAALVLGLLAHAFIEELVFRNVPLAIVGGDDPVGAFAVPLLAFAGIHFLAPGRSRSLARLAQLTTGAVFFFLLARRFGLLHATVAHAMANLSVAWTEGDWRVGALLDLTSDRSNRRFWLNALGYLLAALILLLVYSQEL